MTKLKPYQICRTAEGWTPIKVPSDSGPQLYTVLVAPWGHPRENICECAGYAFTSKCKHQEIAMSRVCGWTELQIGKHTQTKEQRDGCVCPRCKGETLWRMEVIEDDEEGK